MTHLNVPVNRHGLFSLIGNTSQVAGVKRYRIIEGRAEGLEACDVKTGSGFSYTVLPGRGMDIAWADYCGKSLSFIGKGGLTTSQYFQNGGKEWLRSFYAGLLTTCGLTHVGPTAEENGEILGMHGRVSNTPAEEVSAHTEIKDGNIIMTVRGKVREAVIFGENISLRRTIKSNLGESRLFIEDEICNEGYSPSPLMLLYHMNFGFPAIAPGGKLHAAVNSVRPRTEEAARGLDKYESFIEPIPDFAEQVFFIDLRSDPIGDTIVYIYNEAVEFGAYLAFNKHELPCFTLWKNMGAQDYVVGLEPGNCIPEGRTTAADRRVLEELEPNAVKHVSIECGVITPDNLPIFEQRLNALS